MSIAASSAMIAAIVEAGHGARHGDHVEADAAHAHHRLEHVERDRAIRCGLNHQYKPGDAYDPNRFLEPEAYRAAVERLEGIYLEQPARERTAR